MKRRPMCGCAVPSVKPYDASVCWSCDGIVPIRVPSGRMTLVSAAGLRDAAAETAALEDAMLRTQGKRRGPIEQPRRPPQRIEWRNDHGPSCTCFDCVVNRG